MAADAGTTGPADGPADAVLWTGKIEPKPLVEKGTFHDRFAPLRATMLRDEDFGHWFDAEQGRRSIPPSVVAGAFLLALREGCSDREAEQRMCYDLRWKWALGLGLNDHGCDHSSLCVFRARLLAHQEEGRLFREIVSGAVKAGLLTKRAIALLGAPAAWKTTAEPTSASRARSAERNPVRG